MIRVWGRANSINVQKVLWALDEVGVGWSRVDAGGPFGGLDTDAYGALTPHRRIPVLEDDALVVWESNAIVRYLAGRYGVGSLWPTDPGERAKADMWMDWQQTTIRPDLDPLFIGLIRTAPEQRDGAALDAAAARLAQSMTALERHCERSAYLGGQAFTMGDIPLGAAVWRWLQLPVARPDLPAIAAWQARLGERAGFVRHVAQPLR